MPTRLHVSILFLILLCPVPLAMAQSLPMGVTSAAPANLVCDQIGTATVTLQAPSPAFEVMLVIDESSSLDSAAFTEVKLFASSIVRRLRMDPDGTRVGAMMFSSSARFLLGLTGNQQSAIDAINASPQQGGDRCIGCGIAAVNNYLRLSARSHVRRFMIVITAGYDNNNGSLLAAAVQEAKLAGVTFAAIGVGGSINPTELAFIASSIPLTQTVFRADIAGLPTILDGVVSVFPTTAVSGLRIELVVAPELIPTAVLTSSGGTTASIAGQSIQWASSSSLTLFPIQLAIDIRRSSGVSTVTELFTSLSYEDDQGRRATIQNAAIALISCETAALEAEILELREEVASLTDGLADLSNQIAGLTTDNAVLMAQIAELQAENEDLRRQLEGEPSAPTGTGAMTASGQVVAGRMRNVFELTVNKMSDGNLKLALAFKVCEQLQEQADDDLTCLNRVHRLSVSFFTAVQFSDDPSFGPSSDAARAGVDTLVLSGAGSWDGVDGHRFTVVAADRGDGGGPNTDTFSIEIRNADGDVVATAAGTLAAGNIEVL